MYKVIFLLFFVLQNSYASVLDFYHNALHTLKLDKEQIYLNKTKNLKISALKNDRFFNILFSTSFNKRKDKYLSKPFNKTYFNIQDEIDIFNTNKNKIKLIFLSVKSKDIKLDIQKRALFISLIKMIGAYQKTKAILNLYKQILKNQVLLEKSLQQSVKAGNKSKLEYIKFANDVVLLQYKIQKTENILNTMKSTLSLYSPKIPKLSFVQLNANLSQFLKYDPILKLNKNEAKKYMIKAISLKKSWLPKMFVGMQKEYNNDPTGNGDSYTFTVGLKMHFYGGINKSVQAADMEALSINSQYNRLLIQQKMEYIKYYNQYKTSRKSLSLLNSAVMSAQNNLTALKTAYMKHYITLTNYLQALNLLTNTKILYINAKFNNITSALILNDLSTGIIYK